MQSVRQGSYLRQAEKQYEVLKTTTKRQLEGRVSSLAQFSLGHFLPTLKNFEEQLLEYCVNLPRTFYGLTSRDLCSLAFEVAEVNKVPH